MSEIPSIDERLSSMDFPAPLIRQMNQAKNGRAVNLGIGQLGEGFGLAPQVIDRLLEVHQMIGFGDKSILDYGPNAGTGEFRDAVASNQRCKDGYEYGTSNVLSTIGVQNAMQTAIGTLNKLGAKRVLIPEVNFGIYKKIPAGFDMQIETYKLTDDFGIDLEHLRDIVREDDIIILNPVANPTGRVLDTQELSELATILKEKLPEGYVISDEIYDELVYDDSVKTGSFSKYFDRTIICNGVSKSGAMAGLRVGWIVSRNQKLIQAMTSFNTSQISSPPPFNQKLSLPVIKGDTEDTIASYNTVLRANRDCALEVLKSMGLEHTIPKGSFYIFPKLQDTIDDVKAACLAAAGNQKGVVVIPGEAFGASQNVRISLAATEEKFADGMHRFQTLFS